MKHVLYGLLVGTLALTACRKEPQEPKPQTATQTTAPEPAKPDVTITVAFLPTEEPSDEVKEKATAFTAALAEKTGFGVEAMFPKNYGESIRALKKKKAQVAVMSGWAFLKAHYTADGDLLLADSRDGKSSLSAHWYVGADSELKSLSDLAKKRVAFTTPQSAEGFLFPYALLLKEKVVESGEDVQKAFAEVYFTGGEAESLGAVLEGKVDAAAASSMGPKVFLSEEDAKKVRSVGEIDGVPTSVLAVRADMKPDEREKLKEGLLAMNEKAELLAVIGAEKLVERSHGDHMMKLQEAQELVGTEFTPAAAEAPDAPKGLEAPKDGEEAPADGAAAPSK